MTQDIFIKFDGIEGDSQDCTHKGEIEVRNWDWSVSQTSNMHSGSGGGAGKCTVKDLDFVHYTDKSSPNLLQYFPIGKYITKVVLTVRKAGGSPLEYLHITLQEMIITSEYNARTTRGGKPGVLQSQNGLCVAECRGKYHWCGFHGI